MPITAETVVPITAEALDQATGHINVTKIRLDLRCFYTYNVCIENIVVQ